MQCFSLIRNCHVKVGKGTFTQKLTYSLSFRIYLSSENFKNHKIIVEISTAFRRKCSYAQYNNIKSEEMTLILNLSVKLNVLIDENG